MITTINEFRKILESIENNYVGIHCSPKSLDKDDFYGKITDEYYMTFKQILELIQFDYPSAKLLLKKIESFEDGIRLDDESIELVFEIEEFFSENDLEWIFVSNGEAMTNYGDNQYKVYFNDINNVYSMQDELTDNSTIYIYSSKTDKPILENMNHLNEENLLIPRKLEDRKIRLRQNNLKLLQQEVIECNGGLIIDENFDFKKDQVNVKIMNGVVRLDLDHIPEWLENVTINGNFFCEGNRLTTLKNSPKIINGNFSCEGNRLSSLEHCPKIITKSLFCNNNLLTGLKGCPEIINVNFFCNNNFLSSLDDCPKIVKGEFYCYGNKIDFTENYVRGLCDVGGSVFKTKYFE